MTNVLSKNLVDRCKRSASLASLALIIGAPVLWGCGSSSSSTSTGAASSATPTSTSATTAATTKPSYCSAVSSLKQSVNALTHIKVAQAGASGLESAVTAVVNDAKAAAGDAASEFASQANALTSAVNALSATATQLTSSPATAIGQIPGQISAVATAAKGLESVASPKCQ